MEANNPSTSQNNVNHTDPEALVGPGGPVEQDDANPPAPALDQQSQPSKEESNFGGDSSEPLFAMYSKATEYEDDKNTDRWLKFAEGTLVFTGLFSAAIAVLLAVTVQNLFPNSQDTSAFYLGNIYQVLADPNATRTPIPSPIAKPPPFSPSSYFIWVNSLWFLSLVINLISAMLATMTKEWARRYIMVTRPTQCSPKERARKRAFFANGMKTMYINWVLGVSSTLLHLSVFLFFAGLAILLFNVNLAVFNSVVWLIGTFSVVYGLITLMPLFRLDSPYYSPLTWPAWLLYVRISYFFLKIFFATRSDKILPNADRQYLRDLRDRYRGWIRGGATRALRETIRKRLSDIDVDILCWTIDAIDGDDGIEKLLGAIPGFLKVNDLKSKLSNRHGPLRRFWYTSDKFIQRTLSSNLEIGDKARRLDIGMSALSAISISDALSIPKNILSWPRDQKPQDIEIGHAMARWCTSENRHIAHYTRYIATKILVSVRERNDRWYALATRVLDLPVDKLRAYVTHGDDSLSLAILISAARRDIHSDFYALHLLFTLRHLDIRNTLPELQHAFCMLWNDCVEEAKRQPPDTSEPRPRFPVDFIYRTRFHYFYLHQGTDAALRYFSKSTPPESYPSCDNQDHRPGSTISDSHAVPISTQPRDSPHASPIQPTYGSSDDLRLAEVMNVITETPLHDMITMEMRRSSLVSPATSPTLPVHSNSYSPDSIEQQDIAAPWAGRNLSDATTSSPVPPPTAHILNQPLESYDAGPASTLTLPLPTSSDIPTSPSHTPRLPDPELLALLSGTPPSGPRDSATLQRLRARGLINSLQGNLYFTNAVLQLLVHCPPFWNLFSNLGRLTGQTGQRGQGDGQQTGGGTTPLVNATVRLLDDFAYRKEDDDTEPFTPMYVYDAMKEKRQFESMLGGQQRNAEEYLGVYLDVLEEELLTLLTSISTHSPAFTALSSEEYKRSQSGSGQTGVGKRDYISPISRIFDGKFRITSQDDTVKVESRRTLQLDIQPDSVYTVQDALALISQPKSEQVEPSDPSKASQQVTVLIEALPPVLIVHLKRFHYDAVTGGVVKNRKPVQFSPELEIPPDIMVPTAGRPAIPARYTLNGVLYHHGTSASGGRYTVDVLHPNAHESSGEAWVRIDDEIVSTVGHEEVFGRHESDGTDDRCAYLLFYRRTASTQT